MTSPRSITPSGVRSSCTTGRNRSAVGSLRGSGTGALTNAPRERSWLRRRRSSRRRSVGRAVERPRG
eukprot:14759485-Alexandrium_andersonii.AAC.1